MYAAKRFCCGPGADKRDPTKQFYLNLFVYNTVVLALLEETPPPGMSRWDGPAVAEKLNASVHAV
jgi:hypothetical protein